MSEEERRRKSASTLHEEIAAESRADEAEARREARAAYERLAAAVEARAQSAEDAARLWHRLAMGLVVVLTIVIAGLLGVGVSGQIPGVGEISVSKHGGTAPLPVMSPEEGP